MMYFSLEDLLCACFGSGTGTLAQVLNHYLHAPEMDSTMDLSTLQLLLFAARQTPSFLYLSRYYLGFVKRLLIGHSPLNLGFQARLVKVGLQDQGYKLKPCRKACRKRP